MKKNKKKNLILIILILLVVGIAVGYAGFSSLLTINGTANISSTWDVKITSIALAESSVGASNVGGNPEISEDGLTATFNVNLAYPGATATYDVVVTNGGTVEAILDSLEGTNIETQNAAAPTGVTFTCDAVVGDTLAASGSAGATKTYHVTATWDEDDTSVPETLSKTVTVKLNYVQNT